MKSKNDSFLQENTREDNTNGKMTDYCQLNMSHFIN